MVASLTSCSISPKTNRTLGDALGLVFIIERKKIKLGRAGEAVVKFGAGLAFRVTLSAGSTVVVSKVSCRARKKALSIQQVVLDAT